MFFFIDEWEIAEIAMNLPLQIDRELIVLIYFMKFRLIIQ